MKHRNHESVVNDNNLSDISLRKTSKQLLIFFYPRGRDFKHLPPFQDAQVGRL